MRTKSYFALYAVAAVLSAVFMFIAVQRAGAASSLALSCDYEDLSTIGDGDAVIGDYYGGFAELQAAPYSDAGSSVRVHIQDGSYTDVSIFDLMPGEYGTISMHTARIVIDSPSGYGYDGIQVRLCDSSVEPPSPHTATPTETPTTTPTSAPTDTPSATPDSTATDTPTTMPSATATNTDVPAVTPTASPFCHCHVYFAVFGNGNP